jgi:hypothetical protein
MVTGGRCLPSRSGGRLIQAVSSLATTREPSIYAVGGAEKGVPSRVMSAHRVCACGGELEEVGDALFCVGCGARARTWLVFLDGRAVAVGATSRGRGFANDSIVAYTPTFEAQLLELRDGPSEPRRYALPRRWRRGHRNARQHVRR